MTLETVMSVKRKRTSPQFKPDTVQTYAQGAKPTA